MNKPIWMAIAQTKLGLKEVPGPKANLAIVEFLKSTNIGHPADLSDETAWCSAYVNWVIQEARKLAPEIDRETDSAAALSWALWGQELEYGCYGCIVVMTRPGGHHVGFYVSEDDAGVLVLGGNQGDQVCYRHFPWDMITNFRWPKTYKETA